VTADYWISLAPFPKLMHISITIGISFLDFANGGAGMGMAAAARNLLWAFWSLIWVFACS